MTPEELAAIKQRQKDAEQAAVHAQARPAGMYARDVALLLAEVRRLQQRIAELELELDVASEDKA